jgi:hypothetical protein
MYSLFVIIVHYIQQRRTQQSQETTSTISYLLTSIRPSKTDSLLQVRILV